MRDSGGRGGGDPFNGMSHEQMLQWLDQADSKTVQAAADRLAAAAKAIEKIADDLKVRPQWVAWKGEGAEAFRAWSSDLASSTFRLGDFSADSARWLARASEAISGAQAAIPRDAPGSGKSAGASDRPAGKSATDAAKLAADREAIRQEAAGQMRKLGQSYQLSAEQMNALERPVFPPVPGAVAPSVGDARDGREDLTRSNSSSEEMASGSRAGSVVRQHGSDSDFVVTPRPRDELPVDRQDLSRAQQVGTDLDSVDALQKPSPKTPTLPDGPVRPDVPSATGRADPSGPLALPALGQGSGKPLPSARSRMPAEGPATAQRVPPRPVAGGVPQPRETTAHAPMGRVPHTTGGVVGGRPTQTPAGRVPTGTSRTPIVGGTGVQKNMPSSGRGDGAPRTPIQGSARPSVPKSVRTTGVSNTAVPSSGATPARGLPPQTTGGVIGSNAGEQRHSGRLPPGTSAPMRGGISGGVPNKDPRSRTNNTRPAPASSQTSQQQDEQNHGQQSQNSQQERDGE